MTYLCSVCQSFRLQARDFKGDHKLQTSTAAGDYLDLGSIDDVLARSSYCALCRLTDGSLDLSHPRWSPRMPNLTVRLLWTSDYEEDRQRYGNDHGVFLYLKPSIRSEISMMQQNVARCRLLLAGEDRGLSAESTFLTGRPPNDSSNCFKMIKRWMVKCATAHPNCNIRDVDTGLKDRPIMMIDVTKGCLVDIAPSQRYFALSYVWGRQATFETLKSNIFRLRKPGGIEDLREQLPKTITEAMDLVAGIGERFLWCDRLCIVQDDPATKHTLINSMDRIYGAAFAVIMARSGEHADQRLFGCHPLHVKEQIAENFSIVAVPEYRQNSVTTVSALESRAWTFQEQLLARRCLVFDHGLVSFECKSAIWRQDVNLDEPPSDLKCEDIKHDWGLRFNRILMHDHSMLHKMYQNCVQAYSTRKLSFPSDALNAFTGIGKVLATKLDCALYFGLPINIFDWAIIWLAPFNSTRCNHLPSWSWAAWTGTKKFRYDTFLEKASGRSPNPNTWIEWYFDDMENGLVRPLEYLNDPMSSPRGRYQGVIAPSSTSATRNPDVATKRLIERPIAIQVYLNSTSEMRPETNGINTVPLRDGTLRFYTVCASFIVYGNVVKDATRPSYHMNHGMQDKFGLTCGELDNRHDIYEDFQEDIVGKQHFIILSEHNNLWSEERYRAMLEKIGVDSQGCERQHKDFNVLVVEWHEGYAFRKGIGYIRQMALKNALNEPEWRLVVLR